MAHKQAALAVVPKSNPARETLREAIAATVKYNADLAAVQSALAKAERKVNEAIGARDAANAALEAGRISHIEYEREVACGRDPGPLLSLKACRASLTEAEDSLEVAKGSRDALRQVVDAMRADNWNAPALKVQPAVLQVLKAEVSFEKFLADIQRLQTELVAKRLVLKWLTGNGVVPQEGNPDRNWRLPSTCISHEQTPDEWRGASGAVDWEVSWNALTKDADAPVPQL